MSKLIWLALGYNVPVEPSKSRVYVWRKLKEIGAGYFKQGVAILPQTPQNTAKFKTLAVKIREMGGEATLVELKFCDPHDEKETIERFQRQSRSEYDELLTDVAKIVGDIEKNIMIKSRKEYLQKVVRRYKQAQTRDFFKAGGNGQIRSSLEELAADIVDLF